MTEENREPNTGDQSRTDGETVGENDTPPRPDQPAPAAEQPVGSPEAQPWQPADPVTGQQSGEAAGPGITESLAAESPQPVDPTAGQPGEGEPWRTAEFGAPRSATEDQTAWQTSAQPSGPEAESPQLGGTAAPQSEFGSAAGSEASWQGAGQSGGPDVEPAQPVGPGGTVLPQSAESAVGSEASWQGAGQSGGPDVESPHQVAPGGAVLPQSAESAVGSEASWQAAGPGGPEVESAQPVGPGGTVPQAAAGEPALSASDDAWQAASEVPPVEAQQQVAPPVGWAAGQQQPGSGVLFGSAFGGQQQSQQQQTQAHEQPGYQPMPVRVGEQAPPRVPEQRRGMGGLVAVLTVLALLVGGGAGAVGGYLVADRADDAVPTENAFDKPKPPADQASTPPPAGSIESVAAKVLPSVVQIQARGGGAAQGGTGFVTSSDGLIVTNNHVIAAAAEGGELLVVFHDGSTAPAEIIGRDPTSDVAVIKAEGKSDLPVVELGRSDGLKVGQGVVAIGAPFELPDTVTSGIVSALHRPTVAGGDDGSQETVMDAIQTDAAINPGNSGGPLVNMAGQVIGINSAIYSPRSGAGGEGGSVGIGFAIPIDQARRTAEEISKTGKATQTVLGVTVRNNADGGALVNDVTEGGPAAAAGIKSGDVITKLNDRRIDTSDALVAAVRAQAPGDKVKLELSGGSRTVEATLAGQPVEVE